MYIENRLSSVHVRVGTSSKASSGHLSQPSRQQVTSRFLGSCTSAWKLPKQCIFFSFIRATVVSSSSFIVLQNSYAGNAVGFKLSALQQLTDLRANKPRMTLLHYIVDIALKENPALLDFTVELSSVKEASRLSLETMTAELREWISRISELQKQLLPAKAGLTEFKNGML